jgi:hypothetical protein
MWKPLDISDFEMVAFINLVRRILHWDPEARPSVAVLLHDAWFGGLEQTI